MEKANIFNLFFHSVYKQSSFSVAPIETQHANIHHCDSVFTVFLSVKQIEILPISSNTVADGISLFFLSYCSVSLGPLVHSLFPVKFLPAINGVTSGNVHF